MSSLLNIQPSESLQMGKMLVSKSRGGKRQRGKKKNCEKNKKPTEVNIFETCLHHLHFYLFQVAH